MKAFHPVVALGLVALGSAVPGALVPACAAPINYAFNLSAENNSGVSGSGTLALDGTQLTVTLTAAGLTPNQLHPSHIHGLLGAAAPGTTLAPPSADANGDGFVEKTEGAPYEGPPLFDLPPSGTRNGYGRASATGTLSFTQTFDLTNTSLYDPDGLGLTGLTVNDIEGLTGGNTVPFVDRLVELHGLLVPAGIDGTTGTPGTLVYDQEMPVAAGRIALASTAVPEPGTIALLGCAVALLAAARQRPVRVRA